MEIDELINIGIKARETVNGDKEKEWYANVLRVLYHTRAYERWKDPLKTAVYRSHETRTIESNRKLEEDSLQKMRNIIDMLQPNTFKSELVTYHSDQIIDLIRQMTRQAKKEAIDEFCIKHNLCDMCITGGYNCGSDHK